MLGLGLSLWQPAVLGASGPLRLSDGTLSALDLQFTTGSAYINGASVSLASVVACSRASTGYAETASGLLTSFAADTLRRTDKGLLPEQAATNVALYSRDLTNAAWTKTNATAARATGADGVASAGSRLTATAGNATCLQAITLASSARAQSAYVKRVAGSGVIEMTTDNGATWTAITVTSSYSQLSIPVQTLANPTVGFRIVTSGDAIDVDFVQNETTLVTSPIETTTVSATRSADVITMTGTNFTDWFNPVAGTFFAEWTTNATSGDNAVLFASDGTNNNRVGHYISSATRIITSRYVSGGSATNPGTIAGAITVGSSNKSAAAYAVGASQAITCLNGTLSTAASPAADLTAATTLNIGSAFGLSQINGYLRRLSYFNTRVANALMQGQTT